MWTSLLLLVLSLWDITSNVVFSLAPVKQKYVKLQLNPLKCTCAVLFAQIVVGVKYMHAEAGPGFLTPSSTGHRFLNRFWKAILFVMNVRRDLL